MIAADKHWWPVATLRELQQAQRLGKPLARRLHGQPLVLFIDGHGQPTALPDRCPHRHAPLSAGTLHAGQVACPYHGWRFDASGHCTLIPGSDFQRGSRALLAPLACRSLHDLVWVCSAPSEATPEPVAPTVLAHTDSFVMTDIVACTLADAAENFLDGFHTHFVHAGWIRRDGPRQTVQAQIRRLPDGLQARYSDEGLQSGWISRLLEGSRSESFGRFRLPGVAEIEYRGRQGLNLLITAWLTPESPGHLRVHARVATRQGWLPAWLKRAVLQRLFGIILRQDKAILELAQANQEAFATLSDRPEVLSTPLDLLGPGIRSLLAGQPLPPDVERDVACRL